MNIVLLYMSLYKAEAAPQGSGKRFTRPQTNEAAIRHLNRNEDSKPDKIIALCSDKVCTAPYLAGGTATTLDYFRDDFLAGSLGFAPDILEVVPVADSMTESGRIQAITKILPLLTIGDDLYIDLSGGLRDTAMLLIVIARYLQDIRRLNMREVVYTELRGDGNIQVHDSTQLYQLFDLISAVDEFFSTGNVRKLRTYLWVKQNPAVNCLLNEIGAFSDDLALCRVSALNSDIKKIKKALNEVDPMAGKQKDDLDLLLFNLMRERFRTEFEPLMGQKKDGLPAIVEWCASHALYQQALTLLCEEMPEYVCRHIFVQPTEAGLAFMATQAQNKGKSWIFPLFHFHFSRFAKLTWKVDNRGIAYTARLVLTKTPGDSDGNMIFRIATADEANHYLTVNRDDKSLIFDETQREKLVGCILAYQCVLQYRNQINHAGDMAGLSETGILKLNTQYVSDMLTETIDLLKNIQPLTPQSTPGVEPLPLTRKLGQ